MLSSSGAARTSRRTSGSPATPAPRLARGTVVAGRYRILDVLGEGGMGTVYRAEQPALHRQVALKVVRPELSADPHMVARFEREALASSRISSPHVVVVHDFGRDDGGLLYLIMELLEGESLADKMDREGAFPVSEALRIARDIARGLEVAHEAGVVHRDLKPDNVFLTRQGGLKVLDFGIARIVEGPGGSTAGNPTMTGTIVGTPVYMSPEAISRAPVGPAADLYALGVLLYEMLAGEPPFWADEAVVLMSQHLTEKPPSLASRVPSLAKHPELVELVERLLDKRPEARGDTASAAAELGRLTKRFADTTLLEISPPRLDDGPVAKPGLQRRPLGPILGSAAALLVLAVAGPLAVRRIDEVARFEASADRARENEAPASRGVVGVSSGAESLPRSSADGEASRRDGVAIAGELPQPAEPAAAVERDRERLAPARNVEDRPGLAPSEPRADFATSPDSPQPSAAVAPPANDSAQSSANETVAATDGEHR